MNIYKRWGKGWVATIMGVGQESLDAHCGGTLASYFGNKIHRSDVYLAELQFGPFMKMIEELN